MNYTVDISRQVRDAFRERYQLTDDNATLLLEHALFLYEVRCRKQIETHQKIRLTEGGSGGDWWS